MKPSILAAILAAAFFLAPLAYAETGAIPIGNPYADTLQLWSSIASSIESIAQDAASAAGQLTTAMQMLASTVIAPHPQQTTNRPPAPPRASAAAQSASLAAAVASFEAPDDASSINPAPIPETPASSASTPQPIIERITEYAPFASNAFVTQADLTAQLQQLSNSLASKFNSAQLLTVPAWAPSQAIDNLSNVTITNANLTASEIPALDYLSLGGGNLTGTLSVPTLNASTTNYDLLTSTNASSTNLSNFGTASFGGTATSSFDSAGDLTVAGNTTLANATSTNFFATTASSTNLFATAANFGSAIINSLTSAAATITNLVATTITGTNLTVTNATSTNATTTNLVVSNSATIGSLTGFLKAIGGVIATSTVNLASDVSGILPFSNGGTGTTTATGITASIEFLQSTSTAVARTVQSKLSDTISVKDFGAAGNALTYSNGTITAGTNAFSSNSATFTSADVGKVIWIDYAGSGGAPLQTTITGFTDSHHVTLGADAVTSVPYGFLKGVFVAAAQSGSGSYAPGDTITVSGGTATTPAIVTVERTDVISATLVSGGSGGSTTAGSSSGSCVVTGTTGSGERMVSLNVTLTAGVITAITSIASGGEYSANPSVLSAEPVTGCGSLSGATVSLVMGVLMPIVTTQGDYSATASTLTQASTSGSGTGATFTALFVTGGTFVYGTDDTAALTNAFNYEMQLDKAGTPACIYAPAGIYLITSSLPTFYHANGCVTGDGADQTYFYAAPSLTGDVLSWSEDWAGVGSNPFGSPSPLLSQQTTGPVLKDIDITGDQSDTNVQNAVTFYDRDDQVDMENVSINYMTGSCLRMGYLKNTTQAYVRESQFTNIHCFNSGNSNSPAIDVNTNSNGDGTNELDFNTINIYAPNGPGFVIRAVGPSGTRGIHVSQLRVEGQEGDIGLYQGDLVRVGDSSMAAIIDSVQFDELHLVNPYLGYAAFRVTADSSADQPYDIDVTNGDITASPGYGRGLEIDAGRDMSFNFNGGMSSLDYNLYVGASPLVGTGNTVYDNGNESSLHASIDPTAVADVSTSWNTQSINSLASENTAVGLSALSLLSSGKYDTAFGFDAGANDTTATQDTFIGALAGQTQSTGNGDTYVGYTAGHAGTSAFSNTCIGTDSCYENTQGNEITAIGNAAGYDLITGSAYDIILGYNSSTGGLTSAKDTIEVGDQLQTLSPTAYAQLDIGNLLFGTGLASTTKISTGSIGIGTTSPSSRLTVWGTDTASTSALAVVNSASTTVFNIFDNGNASLAGSLTQNSDQRLKTNIQSLDASSSLSLIDALNPVTFNWIDPNKGTTPQLGFIAQQVLPIFPNLVSTTSPTALTPDGTLSLNYIGLISPIVSAIQALDQEVSNLATTVAGFAQSFTTHILIGDEVTANNELCVGSTCVTPTQFQAMVAASGESGATPDAGDDASSNSQATDTPPVIQINGDNPAIVQVGDTYNDLGATITEPQGDLNLGITTYVNGIETSPVQIDTSAAATDTIDYVVTDQNGLTSTSTRTVIVEPAQVSSSVPTDDAPINATSTSQD